MDKLKMHSVNKVDENIAKIGALFPNCLTERINENGELEHAIDFDMLKQELSAVVVEGNEERYQFTWPDKKKSILLANASIAKTLRPCREESVDFDNTENLYIEGDNLDVLKLLQETYLGKIKMIYIDPPYNTGCDFIYKDNFVQTIEEYLEISGQYDEDGNRLFTNTDNNGRFHTDWLNMIYPRLRLAKDLLTDDGVIFISVDDNEYENLKKCCDEVFGSDNYINNISLKTKASAGASGGGEDKRLKKNTESVLIYCKNRFFLNMEKPVEYVPISQFIQEHRENKVGFYYTRILEDFGTKTLIETIGEMKVYEHSNFKFSTVSEKMKTEHLSLDEVYEKYYDRIFMVTNAQTSLLTKVNDVTPREQMLISYEYIPKTGKDKNKLISKYIWNKTLVVWFADSAIKNKDGVFKGESIGTLWDDISWGRLDLQGDVPFKNGKKPLKLLDRMLRMASNEDDIILDFFSGSATTAHAVMQLNAEDGGKRKFIMVQLPEETDKKSEAYKAGYKNICEIGKERIRRAGVKIQKERLEQIELTKHEWDQTTYYVEHKEECDALAGLPDSYYEEHYPELDTGFRVLKLDSTNMKDVYYNPEEFEATVFDTLEDNIKEDRTPEDLLFQVMLDLGVLLSSKIEETEIAGKKVFNVADNFLIACFDENVTDETITAIAKQKPYYFVMRDSSMASDSVATNFDQIFATYSPDTVRKVL